MNYCQKGKELLMDLKRSDFLPAYDDEGVRIIIAELTDIFTKIESIIDQYPEMPLSDYPDSVKVTMAYFSECVNRNLRYIDRCKSFLSILSLLIIVLYHNHTISNIIIV